MGLKRTDEFRKDVVRIALASGLILARQHMRSMCERVASKSRMILASIAPSHTYWVCAAGNGQAIAEQSAERGHVDAEQMDRGASRY